MDKKVNRVYKDSVFSLYMSDPKRLIEVYNAIQGTNYPLDTPVEINTLDDVLYKERINDISFTLDGKYVILIEHQSTINENMPVRMLLYLGRLYEKMLSRKNLYRRKQIPLETPEFLALYNGREPYPEESFLRLSDAFRAEPHENSVELVVKVLNVRYQKDKTILQKSKSLHDYSLFIDQVQKNRDKGIELSEAIRQAVLYCEENNIMQPFLMNHASEVENMLLTEWNWEDAKQVWQEEAREDGRIEGRAEGRVEGRAEGRVEGRAEGMKLGAEKERKNLILRLLAVMPKEQVAKTLQMSVEEIQKIEKS